ncbi:putative estradiol 17 beta-dehydrogenase [Melanomma pulvis-pyrius CBS 109.77]|uniref:Putative estradiol 17 beta-dehydrogenase n=1 Tax=Melanomma pulvis-pyrius CBS 109.77 TaxID=1314802 RepID=A0A6A6XX58_9PLEO|nr:putative estradiol 17 beta-dehydrogenase [Melanomma pulvis-pyrius CBS 109.77]
MVALSTVWTHFLPPKPKFTDSNVPDLSGKVYIVTGANTGIGKELAQLLYSKNAKVYIAARSQEKSDKAINDIKKAVPNSTGSLVFWALDLSDLDNVKAAAQSFLAQEHHLHVLFNNAGVMVGPVEPPLKTAQGHELAIGVNCVGTFLFTRLLSPLLVETAKAAPANTVRVVWLSSFGMELTAVPDIGISTENLDYHVPVAATDRYGISKTGVWALATEYARRYKNDGIVSVPLNPGNLHTELPRDQGFAVRLVAWLVCYPAIRGAYSELFAAFSPELAIDKADWSKSWVGPFGRVLPLRADLSNATIPEVEGGTGGTAKFWDWNAKQVEKYL